VKDNHFVVTGGTSGIGAEICAQLREHGANITVLDLHPPLHQPDQYIAVDMRDNASVDAVLAQLTTPIHGLFNIAGLPPRSGLRESVLRVNFIGLRRLTLGLIEQMAPGAAIVNMSSRAGSEWRRNISQVKAFISLDDDDDVEEFCVKNNVDDTRAYHLSKEAVTVWTMTQTDALIARDLRMNAVSPAAVATGILDDFRKAFGDRVDKMNERLGRSAHPAEVASAAVFLASPASAWIKGIELGVDGGKDAVVISDELALSERSDTT
jgi:NAD(P)-dependent dehydrogenase (short-subunit alcohol dehydrogenase family)